MKFFAEWLKKIERSETFVIQNQFRPAYQFQKNADCKQVNGEIQGKNGQPQ